MISIKMDKKDTKRLCFICDEEIVGNGIQLDSSRTYIGNELLTQKIAEILGEHFVVIVNNEDRLCKDCVAQLNDIDKLEMDLMLVKNSLLTGIKHKYGLPIDVGDEIQPIIVEDGVLKANRSNPLELEQVKKPNQFLNTQQQKVPTPPKVLMPRQVPWPQQILRPQLAPRLAQRPQLAPRQPQGLQRGLIRHPPGKQLRVMLPQQKPQPKQLFKCKICVKYFARQEVCLRHIRECHNEPTSTTMETKISSPASSNTIKCTPQPKFQLNNQKHESPMDDKKEVSEEKEDAAEPQLKVLQAETSNNVEKFGNDCNQFLK